MCTYRMDSRMRCDAIKFIQVLPPKRAWSYVLSYLNSTRQRRSLVRSAVHGCTCSYVCGTCVSRCCMGISLRTCRFLVQRRQWYEHTSPSVSLYSLDSDRRNCDGLICIRFIFSTAIRRTTMRLAVYKQLLFSVRVYEDNNYRR